MVNSVLQEISLVSDYPSSNGSHLDGEPAQSDKGQSSEAWRPTSHESTVGLMALQEACHHDAENFETISFQSFESDRTTCRMIYMQM